MQTQQSELRSDTVQNGRLKIEAKYTSRKTGTHLQTALGCHGKNKCRNRNKTFE